jgi:hypothetical protein
MITRKPDPRWTLDEIKGNYPSLRLPEKAFLSVEQNRQRYLSVIELYRFMNSVPIPIAATVVMMAAGMLAGPHVPKDLLQVWPFDRVLEQLGSADVSSATQKASDLSVCWSSVAVVWAGWLIWRIAVECGRRDVIVPGWRSAEDWKDRDKSGGRYLLGLTALAAVALGAVFLCFVGFVRGPDMFFPSLDDSSFVAAVKGALLIGFAFFTCGFFFLALSPYVRFRIQTHSKTINRGASQ